MLAGLRTYKLLTGYGGAPPCDRAAVHNMSLRVSAMVEAHHEIVELDCNPVIAGALHGNPAAPAPHLCVCDAGGVSVPCRSATTSPACHPGARPAVGGRIDSVSIPLRAISHEITEFEFYISPASS